MAGRVVLALLVAAAVPPGAARAQDATWVKVSVARANVRAQPNETAPVLTQATLGTAFEVRSVQGDWFEIILDMGGMRAKAYISKKVAKPVPPVAGSVPVPVGSVTTGPPPDEAKPAAPAGGDGMSVVVQTAAGGSSWLLPHHAHVAPAADGRIDSLAALASAAAAPASAGRAASSVWIWRVDGGSSGQVIEDRRPKFVVLYRDIPGLSPDDLAPAIVRLAVAGESSRIVAAARGRSDETTRADADWDLGKELKQDAIKVNVEPSERGAVVVSPAADLAPGEYAVVLRPASKKMLSGATVLSDAGEGRVFGVVFDFTIR